MKINKNIIKEPMTYKKYGKEIRATSLKNMNDYDNNKSAYNPLFKDTGKIISLPEDYLYSNTRHNLKDFIIIDGKETKNGDYELIGFLCSSRKNKKTVYLEGRKEATDILCVQKALVSKNKYKNYIKRSRGKISKKTLQKEQMVFLKDLSKNESNISKSKKFKNKKEA